MARPKGRPRRQQKNPQRRADENGARRVVWIVVGVVVLAVVVFVGLSAAEPEPARANRDPAEVAAGEVLYGANCATCHGEDLLGTDTGPPFLNTIYAPNHHGDEAFHRAVAGGVIAHHWNFGTMAPVPGLDRDEVALIVEYVRSKQEAAGIFRDPTHP